MEDIKDVRKIKLAEDFMLIRLEVKPVDKNQIILLDGKEKEKVQFRGIVVARANSLKPNDNAPHIASVNIGDIAFYYEDHNEKGFKHNDETYIITHRSCIHMLVEPSNYNEKLEI